MIAPDDITLEETEVEIEILSFGKRRMRFEFFRYEKELNRRDRGVVVLTLESAMIATGWKPQRSKHLHQLPKSNVQPSQRSFLSHAKPSHLPPPTTQPSPPLQIAPSSRLPPNLSTFAPQTSNPENEESVRENVAKQISPEKLATRNNTIIQVSTLLYHHLLILSSRAFPPLFSSS